jgi:hypothetical protein
VGIRSLYLPAQHKDVNILSNGVAEAGAALKAESGKDIWLSLAVAFFFAACSTPGWWIRSSWQ